jgi:BirA family biotin operon repressor/biotin-[acetyl-CoA-carboxylase] ligase
MKLEILDQVTSTMDVARDNLISGRIQFNGLRQARYMGVLAREQTEGRGQRGRAWFAPPGESLCATYYFRRGLTDLEHLGEISFLAGVAVAEVLRRLLPYTEQLSVPKQPRIGLKWPNDVLLNGKKTGGVLVEMVKAQDGDWVALIGVGINVHVSVFPPELTQKATSLAREGIIAPSLESLGEQIAHELHWQADRRRDAGFEAILRRWRKYDETMGRRFQAEWEGTRVTGIAQGVDNTGALLLLLGDGRTIAVASATSLLEIP